MSALARELGVGGAISLGLGSILGTGVFVSLGLAAGVAGPGVVIAVAAAALIATCNGLSSAQLAAAHPVSGGTYEYGYELVAAPVGFVAGWLFLCAKSASAAAAALGVAGYVLETAGVGDGWLHLAAALGVVLALTAVTAGGVRRSTRVNTVIVGATLAALVVFVIAALPAAWRGAGAAFAPLADGDWLAALPEATALCFVAFTGYGRIATLGEEVREPARSIPRAILATLAIAAAVYLAVAAVSVASIGAADYAAAARDDAAPLARVAAAVAPGWVVVAVGVGAVTAMLGVVLNLLLGLSRVLLAMGRRRDVPAWVAAVGPAGPSRAVWIVGALVSALVAIGDVAIIWSLSAFTVLVYYAITNLAALRLPRAARRTPRAVPALGLVACLASAAAIEPALLLAGCGVIAAGLVWYAAARALR